MLIKSKNYVIIIQFMGEKKKRAINYNKITKQDKMKLLTLTFREGFTLKEASNKMAINYSTAKTILFMYRRKMKMNKVMISQQSYSTLQGIRAHYRDVSTVTLNQNQFSVSNFKPISIFCSVGGSTYNVIKNKQAGVKTLQKGTTSTGAIKDIFHVLNETYQQI